MERVTLIPICCEPALIKIDGGFELGTFHDHCWNNLSLGSIFPPKSFSENMVYHISSLKDTPI